MSYNLPTELKTSKVKSLPDELRGEAEKLIASKFEIKEEVVEYKSSATFQQYWNELSIQEDASSLYRSYDFGAAESITATPNIRSRPEVEKRYDFYSRRTIYSTPITGDSVSDFTDAITRLERHNLPIRKAKATLHPHMARELLSHLRVAPSVMMSGRDTFRLHGIECIITPGYRPEITIAV